MNTIINDILTELKSAEKKHPEFPKDIIHMAAVMAEESGEVVRAALQHHYEGGTLKEVEKELVQTAAMCVRMLKNIGGKPVGEIRDITADAVSEAYNKGHEEGYEAGHDDGRDSAFDEANEEKIGVEYAASAFADCHTLEDFQTKQKEITNRSFNFMPTLGL